MPEDNKESTKKTYRPDGDQMKSQKRDKKKIDAALKYRRRFEPSWKEGAERWNLIAPKGLEGSPNYVIPITRMGTNTGIVRMRRGLPEVVAIPEGKEEKKLAYMIRECRWRFGRVPLSRYGWR